MKRSTSLVMAIIFVFGFAHSSCAATIYFKNQTGLPSNYFVIAWDGNNRGFTLGLPKSVSPKSIQFYVLYKGPDNNTRGNLHTNRIDVIDGKTYTIIAAPLDSNILNVIVN